MGVAGVGKLLAVASGGLMAGGSSSKPKSAAKLAKKADKQAEAKRLSRGRAQQTTLSSPRGVAGMGLKKKLGQ